MTRKEINDFTYLLRRYKGELLDDLASNDYSNIKSVEWGKNQQVAAIDILMEQLDDTC